MAVEDDPRYPRWRAALEAMIAADEEAKTVRHLPETDARRRQAEAKLAAAKRIFAAIADEV